MIIGTGIDLCSHSRIKARIQSEHFVRRVFMPCEIEYAFSRKRPEKHFASSFAAREAFVKASGLEFFPVILKGVWLERNASGTVIKARDEILEKLIRPESMKFWISISHELDMAVAMVLLEDLK